MLYYCIMPIVLDKELYNSFKQEAVAETDFSETDYTGAS